MAVSFNNKLVASVILLLLSVYPTRAQQSFIQKFETVKIYAGIEVGSKGVKMSLLELTKDNGDNGFNILKDTTVNTDFISFTQPTFQATLQALNQLYAMATGSYKIPSAQVFTAISSGVYTQAVKANMQPWINQLVAAFKQQIQEPNRQVTIVDVKEEARLSHLGIVPVARRYNTFLIDIGSGNTKGGYFPYANTKDFKLFELTWGTKSTGNAAEKMMGNEKTIENYYSLLSRVLAGAENNEIVYAVNVSGAFPQSDYVAFSGGIAWAVATLLAPELNDNPVVGVNYDDVIQFNEKLLKNPALFSDYYLLKTLPANTADAAKLEKDVRQVHKVFDQRALLAGTGLLLKIMRQFDGVVERKKFYLVKNGAVGWISAFVNQQLEQ